MEAATTLSDELDAAFAGQFMRPQIFEDSYFLVETTHGTECIPADVIGRNGQTVVAEDFASYVEGKIINECDLVPCEHGFIARLSAPGYLDCTEWSWHKSWREAAKSLLEMYAD